MRLILGYALLIALSAVVFFVVVQPEIERVGQTWQGISDAVAKATGG